ncbi:MAG: tetratricopeptide repeat protein, partial [Spirochaetaceae bacterium]|nr:tetratricopeptide repeat protein [Spirochaetaceae bacterium]
MMRAPLAALLLFLVPAAHILPQAGGAPAQAEALYRQGREAMAREDWYAAAESFLECLALNPAHAEATASLAECYYELGEFEETLVWVRKARSLARSAAAPANLEASTLIALGRLDEASALLRDVLLREPYNREALFSLAELDLARGHGGDALNRYREAARRFPDDRRVLVSLALVSASLGESAAARNYIERAMLLHPGDHLVYYMAAYLDSQEGRLPAAIAHAERALNLRGDYAPALSLLAALRYRSGDYTEAARLADVSIAANRADLGAWYLKGMAYARLGRPGEARAILSTALSVDPGDEFIRSALEDLVITHTAVEDPERSRWADWHFNRAGDFENRNQAGEALFEYRRGLRLNPYAPARRSYAELLRRQGYPARFLEELSFMRELGLDHFSAPERQAITDAIENYDAVLTDSLYRRWAVEAGELARRHWKVAVFFLSGSPSRHVDAALVCAALIRDILVHDRNVETAALALEQPSFSAAFRSAREAGADYFLVISASENERDLSIAGGLYVGRTGSPAGVFHSYRTGPDRLRNSARNVVAQLGAALPFRGVLLRRRAAQALIDKGKADGITPGLVFNVVKRGRSAPANEGIAVVYSPGDLVGTFTTGSVDEEVSAGLLTRT